MQTLGTAPVTAFVPFFLSVPYMKSNRNFSETYYYGVNFQQYCILLEL